MSFGGIELWPPGFVAVRVNEAKTFSDAWTSRTGERATEDLAAPGIEVHPVGGVDQVAPVREQPLDPVVVAAFLVGGEGENQVPIRDERLLAQAQEGGGQRGGAAFDVDGAASVEVAVLLVFALLAP